jgi:glutamyl-tRNA reductase
VGICVIGLNYKSALLDVREQLVFSRGEALSVLNNSSEFFGGCEIVLLSTCNRTEIYIACDGDAAPDSVRVIEYLLQQKSLSQPVQDVSAIMPHIFMYKDLAAVEHLFFVVSGLDSMLLGEVQIAGQVKLAYQLALEAGTVGALFNRLFQAALKTAKQVTNETELHKHRVSLPSIAVVDFALQVFERLDDKRVLVLGAGEMGRETLQYLCEYGAKNITISNRSIDKAELLAVEFGGKVVDWSGRFDVLAEADLVISATGASDYVVMLSDFQRIALKRGKRALLILDLAAPRDFEKTIGELGNVYLYSIDDLEEACMRNRAGRERETPKAKLIAQRNANEFMRWLSYRPGAIVIRKLREQLEGLKDVEVERLFNKLSDLNEREKAEIIYSFERFTGKILHLPLSSLRDESKNGEQNTLLKALARLFRINE